MCLCINGAVVVWEARIHRSDQLKRSNISGEVFCAGEKRNVVLTPERPTCLSCCVLFILTWIFKCPPRQNKNLEPPLPSSHLKTWAVVCGRVNVCGFSSCTIFHTLFSLPDSACLYMTKGMTPNETFYGPVDLLIVPQVVICADTKALRGVLLGSGLVHISSPLFLGLLLSLCSRWP